MTVDDELQREHELAELIQAGKVVKGEKDGRLVPYLLAGPVLPPYTQKQHEQTTIQPLHSFIR